MVILLACSWVSQSFKCLVYQMKFLFATTFVRMNLQSSSFECQLYLFQSGILLHQQNIVQGSLGHQVSSRLPHSSAKRFIRLKILQVASYLDMSMVQPSTSGGNMYRFRYDIQKTHHTKSKAYHIYPYLA